MMLDEIIEKLKDKNIRKVARKSGIHYNTLYNFINKRNSPNVKTLLKLEAYLNGQH